MDETLLAEALAAACLRRWPHEKAVLLTKPHLSGMMPANSLSVEPDPEILNAACRDCLSELLDVVEDTLIGYARVGCPEGD